MVKLFIIIFFVTQSYGLHAQTDTTETPPVHYNVDSLKKIYGVKKHLLKEYELQSLIALSYYPELLNEHIVFKYAAISGTAQTTVTFGSIFKRVDKQYIVFINTNNKRTGLLLSDAPFDAEVAVLGHELAHVCDFKKRGFLDMVWWGLGYLFVKRRGKIEHKTDLSTIRHGLGWQLYSWSDFVLNHSAANEHYKKIRRIKYLQPAEIAGYIKRYNLQ